MTPEQIEQMRADMEAGTPVGYGPWGWFEDQLGPYLATQSHGRIYVMICHRKGMHGAEPLFQVGKEMVSGVDHPDARRIARVPDMEAEILRLREVEQGQTAEIARLRDALKKLDVGEGWAAQIARAALNGDAP